MVTSLKIPGTNKTLDQRLMPLLAEAEVELREKTAAELIDRLLIEKMPSLDRLNTNFHYHRKALHLTQIALRLCTEKDLYEAMECYKPGTAAIKPLYIKFGHFSDNREEKTAGIKSYAVPILYDHIKTCIDMAENALSWHTNKNKDEDHAIIDKTPVTEQIIYNRMIARRSFEKEFKPEAMPQFYKDAAEKTAQFWMAQLLSSPEYRQTHGLNNLSSRPNTKAFTRASQKKPEDKNPFETFKETLMREMFNSGRSIVKTTHAPDDQLTAAVMAANIPFDEISLPKNMHTKCEDDGTVSVYKNNKILMTITRMNISGSSSPGTRGHSPKAGPSI